MSRRTSAVCSWEAFVRLFFCPMLSTLTSAGIYSILKREYISISICKCTRWWYTEPLGYLLCWCWDFYWTEWEWAPQALPPASLRPGARSPPARLHSPGDPSAKHSADWRHPVRGTGESHRMWNTDRSFGSFYQKENYTTVLSKKKCFVSVPRNNAGTI